MPDKHAFKILRAVEYAQLSKDGTFTGSPVDLADGYIHLSMAEQLQGTLDKHYTDGDELTLLEVDLAACQDEVKFEISRGGARFPHLYGPLGQSAVRRIWQLHAGPDGRYNLPADITDTLES